MLRLWPANAAATIMPAVLPSAVRPTAALLTAGLLTAVLLTACGGGGGGGGDNNNGGGVTPAGPALTFTPATVSATLLAGVSSNVSVNASVNRPADFSNASTVFALITDSSGVLLPSAQLIRDSDTQYHASLQTAPTLAAGSYTGNFSVKLCKDSACASQFPGSPMQLPYNFQVNPPSAAPFGASSVLPLTASVHQGGAAPAPVIVNIVSEGRSWSATAGAAWIKLSSTSGTGSGTLSLSYDATGLALGQYDSTLSFSTSDGQGAALPVSLTVLPSGLVISSSGVAFNAINGAPIPSQSVLFDTDNKVSASWSVASSAAWLRATPAQGSTPASAVLTIDPSKGPLVSGSYNASLTLSASGLSDRTLPVALTLVKPTLLASANSLTLGGTFGRDFSPQTLTLSLNTATNSWPWSFSALPAWSSASVSSGNINQAMLSSVVTPLPAKAAVGTTSAQVTASALVNGDTVDAPVLLTINKDQHKLLPSEIGVAFSATPGWSRLSRTLTINDNFGNFAGMSAQTGASWLTVSVSGNQLKLLADPTTLATDNLYTTTVTLVPQDSDVTAPETIRVALWKGTLTPVGKNQLPLPYNNVAADPIRPLVYVHNGGAFIDVYNIYNGQKVATMVGASGSLGDMTVSPNGERLYLIDIDNNNLTGIDLNTRLVVSHWPLAAPANKNTRIKTLRPNGVAMVLLSDGTLYAAADGSRLGAAGPDSLQLAGGSLATSADGKRVYQQDEDKSGIQLTTYSVDYAALGGGRLFAQKVAAASHIGSGGAGQDIAASTDGSKVYTASSTPKQCSALNPADLSILYYLPSGDAAPNNIEVGSDGRVFCGVAGKNSNVDVWVYSDKAVPGAQLKFAASGKQLLPRQMAVSGDALMLIGLTDDGAAILMPVGP